MKPVLQALLVADTVYLDKQTGKKIICGVFHTLVVLFKSVLQQEVTSPEGQKQTLIVGGMQVGSATAYISLPERRRDMLTWQVGTDHPLVRFVRCIW